MKLTKTLLLILGLLIKYLIKLEPIKPNPPVTNKFTMEIP